MGGVRRPERFDGSHKLTGFSSGSNELDFWLREKASLAHRRNTARTYVSCTGDEVVAYYAIAAGSIIRTDLPRSKRFEMPNHPIPLILLARLAVDLRYQGQGLGTKLVLDAIGKAIFIGQHAGVFALATNAIDENAISFYQSLGFLKSPGDATLMLFPLTLDH